MRKHLATGQSVLSVRLELH